MQYLAMTYTLDGTPPEDETKRLWNFPGLIITQHTSAREKIVICEQGVEQLKAAFPLWTIERHRTTYGS